MSPIKRLILLRHAKSSWKSDAASDHERPLNGRGRHDAPRIGQELDNRGWWPEQIFSSDSVRTRQTVDRLFEHRSATADETPIDFLPDLYHGSVADCTSAIAAADRLTQTLMLVGHNPGMEDLYHWLVGEGETITTCNAALLHVAAESWEDAAAMPGEWLCEQILRPKELDTNE